MAQFTTWNGSAQRTAFGQRSATTCAIQSAPSARHVGDLRRTARARAASKNAAQGGLVPARARPTPAGRNRGRPRRSGTCGRACRRSRRSRSGAARRTGHAAASTSAQTRAMIAPTVRHAIRISSRDRGLRALGRQPGDLLVEDAGVTRAVPGPRHRRHRRPVLGAVHPRRVGLQPRPGPCPGPAPATGAGPRPGHSPATAARSARTATAPRAASAARRDQRPARPRRTRRPRRPSSRPPAAARHKLAFCTPFSAPRFLFFDSSET